MQILINIPENQLPEGDEFSQIDCERIKRNFGLQQADAVSFVNIGPGADWIVLLTVFNIIWSVFQLPGNIKDSLDGWQWLVNLMKTKIRKKELVSLDIDAAGMLAIDYLADKYGDDSSFNLIDAHSFNIIDINGMVHNREGSLEANPHNYYVFTFDIAGKVIVLSVRSTGKIRILESFEVWPYGISN